MREQRAEYLTAARPEIIHMFRPPEKRPPTVVSTVFVALVAAPVLVLLVLWSRLGINLDALARVPKIHALVFHVSLIGSIAFICLLCTLHNTIMYITLFECTIYSSCFQVFFIQSAQVYSACTGGSGSRVICSRRCTRCARSVCRSSSAGTACCALWRRSRRSHSTTRTSEYC